MKTQRIMGYTMKKYMLESKLTYEDVAAQMGWNSSDVRQVMSGRKMISLPQIKQMAKVFKVPYEDIINGDVVYYNDSIVHCMNPFVNIENREKILDIIEDYLDVYEAVNS